MGDLLESARAFSFWGLLAGGANAAADAASVSAACAFSLDGPTDDKVAVALPALCVYVCAGDVDYQLEPSVGLLPKTAHMARHYRYKKGMAACII